MSKLIVGCGYLGSRVAARWLAAGEEVNIITRSSERAHALEREGFRAVVADVLRPESLLQLPRADTVFYAVGYDRQSGASMREVYVEGLRSVLDALPHDTGKFIYISSTGVYGQTDGEWVDETSPCEPTRPGGQACLEAERLLAAHALGARAVVLRLAGIYGPGRVPNAAEIRRQQPLAAPAEGFLNLIHVDDAAAVVLAAEARARTPALYVISDGHPVERRAYYQMLAQLLGAGEPRFTAPVADSPAALRAGASKRVKNARMAAELDVALVYPSYRQGLAAIVAAEASGTPDAT